MEAQVRDINGAAMPRLLLTVEEASEVLSISRTTMFYLLQSGQVRSVQIGRLRRVPIAALEAFVEEHCR